MIYAASVSNLTPLAKATTALTNEVPGVTCGKQTGHGQDKQS